METDNDFDYDIDLAKHKSIDDFDNTHDIIGAEYAKLSELKPGDKVQCDGGFTCLHLGDIKEVKVDKLGFYIECDDLDGYEYLNPLQKLVSKFFHQHHYLDGQVTDFDGDHLIGLYKV